MNLTKLIITEKKRLVLTEKLRKKEFPLVRNNLAQAFHLLNKMGLEPFEIRLLDVHSLIEEIAHHFDHIDHLTIEKKYVELSDMLKNNPGNIKAIIFNSAYYQWIAEVAKS